MRFCGIDPGSASGAIADIGQAMDNPWAEDCNGTPAEIWSKFGEVLGRDYKFGLVALERVHTMPKQGISSAGKFMENFGTWQGILLARGIPFELVSPRSWQKEILGSAGSTNDGSLEYCRRHFPHLNWSRQKDHNRADALCLALWARKRSLNL